jgi:hypothetical protein
MTNFRTFEIELIANNMTKYDNLIHNKSLEYHIYSRILNIYFFRLITPSENVDVSVNLDFEHPAIFWANQQPHTNVYIVMKSRIIIIRIQFITNNENVK